MGELKEDLAGKEVVAVGEEHPIPEGEAEADMKTL